jgi:VIT1/CCC1 family predicted Fe2+/Mn2+ transporter
MAHDALDAHARDELGITEMFRARPLQAAAASAASFAVGAVVPLLVAAAAPGSMQLSLVFAISLVCLALLGAVAARTGGAAAGVGALRIAFWGALAMGATTGTGMLFGAAP